MPPACRDNAKLLAVVVAVATALIGCSADNTEGARGTEPSAPTSTPAAATEAGDPPCGVTLAEVQALLPPDSGVTQNQTPDLGRCNFTWDDSGPRGIDVAILPGGRAAFDVPAGYEPLDGYGDEAFASTADGRASAFAFVGDDLYAADVVADSAGTSQDELRALCLQLLELTLN